MATRFLVLVLPLLVSAPVMAESSTPAEPPATAPASFQLSLQLGPRQGNLVPLGDQLELFAEAAIENPGDKPRQVRAAFLVVRDASGNLLRASALAGLALHGPYLVLDPKKGLGDPTPTLAPGSKAVLFLPPLHLGTQPAPAELRLSLVSVSPQGGPPEVQEVSLPLRSMISQVSPEVAPVFPVTGTWVALNGPSDWSAHRRAVAGWKEGARIPQRFALDLIQFQEDATRTRGDFVPFRPDQDPTRPESYFCYGKPVRAVLPGEVVEAVEGLPDRPLGAGDPANLAGNHVVIRHAEDLYGCYAHLAPGSLVVKKGDKLEAGQLLGKVGNSGNTTQPHLHLHFTRGPDVLRDAAVPLGFAGIAIRGRPAPPAGTLILPRDGEVVEAR